MPEQRWYYLIGEKPIGPLTWSLIRDLAARSEIQGDTQVAREGTNEWRSYESVVQELKAAHSGMSIAERVSQTSPRRSAADIQPTVTAKRSSDRFPHSPRTVSISLDPSTEAAWKETPPAPWRRFLARWFDIDAKGIIVFILIYVLATSTAPQVLKHVLGYLSLSGSLAFVFTMLGPLVVIPINAVLIGLTGFTLGKLIFGVRVMDQKTLAPIGLRRAFSREIWVWLEGLGLGIPIVSNCSRSL